MRTPAARADMRLTYDDFVLFPDDGKRHEIIDGEHYVTPRRTCGTRSSSAGSTSRSRST